jgi:hypothetical protein
MRSFETVMYSLSKRDVVCALMFVILSEERSDESKDPYSCVNSILQT